MFMFLYRQRGTSTSSSRPASASGSGSKTSTALRILVAALTLGGQALAQTPCGCQFDHDCFPADGVLLKEAADAFVAGTWHLHSEYTSRGPIEEWCTNNVENMSELFKDAADFDADISQWNTAAVTTMRSMFHAAKSFTKDLNQWEVSSVTDMHQMFSNAEAFNGDITQWDVSAVTDMGAMFAGAFLFNQDVSQWKLSAVTSIQLAFYYASAFNQNLCSWGREDFPYDKAFQMFGNSGCEFLDDPKQVSLGPFCGDECGRPSAQPSSSSKPSSIDVSTSKNPSEEPSSVPSSLPSLQPSSNPSSEPSVSELSSVPSSYPSNLPSSVPSNTPSGAPSIFSCEDRTSTVVGVYSQPYLNTSPVWPPCHDETSNLLSIIAHFKDADGEFATFESSESIKSFDDPDLETKLNEVAFFVMPEIEDIGNNPLTGWGTGPQNILRYYVANGGVILVIGAYGGGISFLNDIFGWDLSSAFCPSSSSSAKNVANSAGTVFEDGPDTLGCPNTAGTINCNSVDCTVMYGDESAALVTVIENGEGRVIVLGSDYYNTGYEVDGYHQNCSRRHGDWVTSIFRSSLLLASECPRPSTDKPSYQPSMSIQPSQPPSYEASKLPTSVPSLVLSDTPSSAPSTSGCEDRTGGTTVGVYSQPYLNTLPGQSACSDETSNLLSIITHFKDTDGEFATFESSNSIQSFDDPDLETKLNEVAFFVMPDMEGNDLAGWGTGPQNILRNYVADGGVMLVTGLPQGGALSFLNDIFGWDLTSTFCSSSSSSVKNVANSADTVFEDGPDTIGCPSVFVAVNCNSVDCTVMYGDESTALVTVIEYGEGSVIVLGFDYVNTGYEVDGYHQNCSGRQNNWVTSIFRSSLLFAAAASCEQPSSDKPSYQPSMSIQPSQPPSYLRCGCEFDHMCFPADGVLLKKAADAFCAGTWDSSHPDFADHGPIEEWCTGLVTNMSRLFMFRTNVDADLSKWNTAAVVNMRSMFSSAGGSFSSTIGSWDVSSVTNMARMFGNSQFSGDISEWNTASVKNMAAMFRNTAWFNSDISGWNTASVTNMQSMFRNAAMFNSDISGWTVSSVIRMTSMFNGAASFNIDLAGWDLSSVDRMYSMFRRAGSFNQNLCAWKENFPYDQANNIFHRSGCTFTENPDEDNGGPFCAHDCSPPSSVYTTSNVDVARSFARGVMYTISAKSKQVTIKGLGVLGRKAKESNIRMYYQNGSYLDFEAFDVANWIQVFRGNVMLEANEVVTIPLTQEFTIPAGGSVSVYVVSPRGMSVKRVTENEEEFDVYAESDSFMLKVGVSTRKVFNERIGLAEFAGTIVYEV